MHDDSSTGFQALDKAVLAAGMAIKLAMRVPAPLKPLADQVIRSASSVPANLAEGRGRTGRDRLHHWRIAFGSARERPLDQHPRLGGPRPTLPAGPHDAPSPRRARYRRTCRVRYCAFHRHFGPLSRCAQYRYRALAVPSRSGSRCTPDRKQAAGVNRHGRSFLPASIRRPCRLATLGGIAGRRCRPEGRRSRFQNTAQRPFLACSPERYLIAPQARMLATTSTT